MNRILAIVAILVAALFAGPHARTVELPPCQTEDSVSCYWDATHRGNGLGESFWTDTDGTQHAL
jgi:hypothetical protein